MLGYRNQEIPQVNIDSPPAIGNEFKSPILTPMMQSTGKILCIDVVDPGTGYLVAPEVSIADLSGKGRGAEACAIIGEKTVLTYKYFNLIFNLD